MKALFISDIATPQWIKFSSAVQGYFEAFFLFYEYPDRTRGSWWRIPLGPYCAVFDRVLFRRKGWLEYRYVALDLFSKLRFHNPDVIILGGFSRPGNFFAYLWGIFNRKKTIVFTERSRDPSGGLRKFNLPWILIRLLYAAIDMVIVTDVDTYNQFALDFKFGNKVVIGRYPSDLEDCLRHGVRSKRDNIKIIFANRLVDIYNPLMAINVFYRVHLQHPSATMVMNSQGELRAECDNLIKKYCLENSVSFANDFNSWSDLHRLYEKCDVLFLPAKFSNGNYTVFEAMASGMGIVISDKVLGNGALITNEINGFKSDLSECQFASNIIKYIEKNELLNLHGRRNKTLVYEYGVDGTAILYSQILSKFKIS